MDKSGILSRHSKDNWLSFFITVGLLKTPPYLIKGVKMGSHPKNRGERRLFKIKKEAHMKNVIEPKNIPSTMKCDICGNEMKLISIEKGYSCRNSLCSLHYSTTEEVEAEVEALKV